MIGFFILALLMSIGVFFVFTSSSGAALGRGKKKRLLGALAPKPDPFLAMRERVMAHAHSSNLVRRYTHEALWGDNRVHTGVGIREAFLVMSRDYPWSLPRHKIDDAQVLKYVQSKMRLNTESIAANCEPAVDANELKAADHQRLNEIWWNEVYTAIVDIIDARYAERNAAKQSLRRAESISQARKDLHADPYEKEFRQLGR